MPNKKAANRVETKNMIMMMIAPILTFFVRLFWWWKTHSLIWIGWFGVCVVLIFIMDRRRNWMKRITRIPFIHTYQTGQADTYITHIKYRIFFFVWYISGVFGLYFFGRHTSTYCRHDRQLNNITGLYNQYQTHRNEKHPELYI